MSRHPMTLLRRRITLMFILICLSFLFLWLAVNSKQQDTEALRFSYRSVYANRWTEQVKTYCSGNYVTYSHRFFTLSFASYDPRSDKFSIPCSYSYIWNNPRHHDYYGEYGEYAPKRYTKSLEFRAHTRRQNDRDGRVTNLTIAVYREYPHNFYHAMTQWYNVFVLSKLLKFDPTTVTVLLLDRGPTVHIDAQWEKLYNKVLKAADLSDNIYLGNALFNIAGHESLLYYFQLKQLPFAEEFSKYFMKTFDLSNSKPFSCSNISVTLVLRRDYLMYLGNSSSRRNTERKYLNEAELVKTLHDEFPGHSVRTLVAENLALEEQLRITTNTDVLIGMHGCVLSQTLFLPPHAMVLEMYPIFWERKSFFSSMAKWRRIQHDVWQNDEEEHEFRENCSTYVPPVVFRDYAKRVKKHFKCL